MSAGEWLFRCMLTRHELAKNPPDIAFIIPFWLALKSTTTAGKLFFFHTKSIETG